MERAAPFFVTSYGRTSTVWLTRALNLHPEIICSHGPSLTPIITKKTEDYDKAMIVDAQKSVEQFYKLGLREIVSEISAGSTKRYVGSVHAFTASNLAIKCESESDAPRIHTVNLLRHPVTRIDSFWRRWQYERTFNSPVSEWIATTAMSQERYQHMLKTLQAQHDVPVEDFSDRAFFHAVMQMSADDGDLRTQSAQIVTERLVVDIDYYCHVLNLLTDGTIPISHDYLKNVSSLGKQNASEGASRSAIETFEQWQPWQRTLFRLFVNDHPFLMKAYFDNGYSMPERPASLATAAADPAGHH